MRIFRLEYIVEKLKNEIFIELEKLFDQLSIIDFKRNIFDERAFLSGKTESSFEMESESKFRNFV